MKSGLCGSLDLTNAVVKLTGDPLAFGFLRPKDFPRDLSQPLLAPFSLADVMQKCAQDVSLFQSEAGDGYFHRKLTPLPVQGHQLEPPVQVQSPPAGAEALQAAQKGFPISRGQNGSGDRAANYFFSRPSKQPLRLAIPINDCSLRVQGDEGIMRGLNDEARSFFALAQDFLGVLSFGNVPRHFGETAQVPGVVTQSSEGDMGPELSSIAANPPAFLLKMAFGECSLECLRRFAGRDVGLWVKN